MKIWRTRHEGLTDNAAEPQTLAGLRQELQVTQAQLAEQLAVTQPAVLRMERAEDLRVSSLRRFVDALGRAVDQPTSLQLHVVVGARSYTIALPISRNERHEDMQVKTRISSLVAHGTGRGDGSEGSADHPRGRAPTVWRLRAWDDPTVEDRFRSQSIIAIGGDEVADLTVWPAVGELRKQLKSKFPERADRAIDTFVRYWEDFCRNMQTGDIVVVPLLGKRAMVGTVEGPYKYDPGAELPTLRHTRSVRWLRVVPRTALSESVRKVVNAPGTICRISDPSAPGTLLPDR